MSELNFTKEAWVAYNEKLKKSFANSPKAFTTDYTEWIKIQTNVLENTADFILFRLSSCSGAGALDSVIQWNLKTINRSYAYNIGSISIKEAAIGVKDNCYVIWINFDSVVSSLMVESAGVYSGSSIYNVINTLTAKVIDGDSVKLSETGFIGGLDAYNISIAKESDMSEVVGKSYDFKFVEEGTEIRTLTAQAGEEKKIEILPTDATGNLVYLLLKADSWINVDLLGNDLTISTDKDGVITATSTIDPNISQTLLIIVL